MSVLTDQKVVPMESGHRLTAALGHYYIHENNAYLAFYCGNLVSWVRDLRAEGMHLY